MKTEQPIVLKGWSQGEMAERLAEGVLVKRDTITMDEFKVNTKEWLIDKLESMNKEDALKAICNLHDELNKPQYPKTYEECCEVLGLGTMDTDAQGYKCLLIMRFQELLIARDAYWKIAGDWKPDWQNRKEAKYGIIFVNNERYDETTNTTSILLAFPTEEMRDAFYENFKELIEECKELL